MIRFYLILILTLLSLNSFAGSYYNTGPMNVKHVKKLTKDSIIDTNFQNIQDAAFDGSCTVDGYKLDYDPSIKKNLLNLGYEVTSNEKGGWLITWCD